MSAGSGFRWGEEIEVREGPIPFRIYDPRRTHVAELLEDSAGWGSRDHLVQGSRRLTFDDVFEAVDVVARRLREAGLRPGDRLLILSPNSPEWAITLWAVLRLDAIAVLGNGWWGELEVAHAVDLVEPRLALVDPKRADLLPASLAEASIAVDKVAGWIESGELVGGEPEVGAEDEDRPAVIIFTAGTTGPPNAVTLAHRSVIANIHGLLAMSGRLPHQIDPDRPPAVSLQTGPLFHIGGLQSLLLAMLGGNTLVFLEGRFEPEQVLDLIERERVSWWAAVPTMASRVLDSPTLAGRDLSSVRSVSMGGAPVQPRLLERLTEAFPSAGRGLSTVYGMTETGGTLAAASGRTMAEHPATAGRPMRAVELKIDAGGAAEGEIVARTPGQMLGYWGRADADPIDAQGWIHTGDLGRIEDGLLYVTGRIKDIIIRGGENIAPAHIESVLLGHPSVANVAAVGLPDDDLGERVAAIVQAHSGEDPTPADLSAFAASSLARFELPAEWRISQEPLPMSDTGKVDKRKLRSDLEAAISSTTGK